MASSMARYLSSHLSKASPSISLHHRASVLCFSSASQGKEEHLNNSHGFTDDSGSDLGVRTQATDSAEAGREGPGKMSELGYKATEKVEEGSQRTADKAAGFGEAAADGPGKAWDAAKGTAEKVKGSVGETVAGGAGKVWEAAKGTAEKVKESVVGKSEVDDKPMEDYIEDHVGKPMKKGVDADVDLKDKEGFYDQKH